MKIKGLKKVAGATKDLKGDYDSIYLQCHYDRSTGEVFTTEYCDFGHNSYTKFADENIVNCGIICKPETMAEIRERVETAVELQNIVNR